MFDFCAAVIGIYYFMDHEGCAHVSTISIHGFSNATLDFGYLYGKRHYFYHTGDVKIN